MAHAQPAPPQARQAVAMVLRTLLALLALVGLTCWASYQPLGGARLGVGLGIAVLKIALVAWCFMGLRRVQAHGGWIVAALALAGLTAALLFGLSATDYAVRPPAKAAYQVPQQLPAVLRKPAPPPAPAPAQ